MTEHGDRYLVMGATGMQGRAVARRIATLGRQVDGMSAAGGNVGYGVRPVRADLAVRDQVFRAFEGVTQAAIAIPLVYDLPEVIAYATNIADAANAAGVRHLVFNTTTRIPSQPTPYAAFETRRAAETVLRDSGLPIVILRPTIYLDNLFGPWTAPALVNEGILAYPLPADLRVAWISHTDTAAAVVAALELSDLAGRTVSIGGPQAVTGPELAAAFSTALSCPITYHPQEVAEFESRAALALGPQAAAGMSGIYRWAREGTTPDLFGTHPTNVHRALGTYPTPLTEWISAQPWCEWAGSAETLGGR
jgi:uncharacterized protein YbjT (DUF2867 family)